MLLLIDTVEHVHTARITFMSASTSAGKHDKGEGHLLCEPAANALDADQEEDKRKADAFVFVSEDADRGFERKCRQDHALYNRGESKQAAGKWRKTKRDGRS